MGGYAWGLSYRPGKMDKPGGGKPSMRQHFPERCNDAGWSR